MATANLRFILEALWRGQGIQKAEKDLKKVAKVSKTLAIGFGAVSAAGTALITSSTKLAARVETLGVVVNQVGGNLGYSSDQMDQFTQSIVDQGITLRSARESLALMAQAEIDFARGADLARVAQDAAVIANENSSESFKKLVYIAQTGNLRMARTLGLIVDFQGAYKAFAESTDRTVESLSQQEKVQIRVNQLMEAGANISGTYEAAMETVGKQVLSLDRHLEESRRIIGEAFLPIFADLVSAATKVLKAFQSLSPGMQRGIAVAIGMTTAWAGLAAGGLTLVALLPTIQAGLTSLGVASSTALGPIGLLIGAIAATTTAIIALDAAGKKQLEELERARKEVGKNAHTYEEYVQKIKALAEEQGATIRTQEEYNELVKAFGRDNVGIRRSIVLLTEAEWELATAKERSERAYKTSAEYLGMMNQVTEAATGKTHRLADAEERFAAAAQSASSGVEGFYEESVELCEWMDSEGLQTYQDLADIMRQVEAGTMDAADALVRLHRIRRFAIETPAAQVAPTAGGGGYIGFQYGGKPPSQGVATVGEEGWEFMINGVIVPHLMSKKLAQLGLRPSRGFWYGGPIGTERGTPEVDIGAGAGGGVAMGYAYTPPTTAPVTPEAQAIQSVEAASQRIALGQQGEIETVKSQLRSQERQNKGILKRLDQMIEILTTQGTAQDMAAAVSENIQYLDME